MAAFYKARDLAQYVPEPIPSAEFKAVTGGSHASSAQGAWSEWVTDLPGKLPQLTPASMLMPLVNALPPPDMRLPPKPIRRLDPAALRHFELQAVVGAPPRATAIDGGPLSAQAAAAMASREAASSSLSGRSSADGSQKPASKAEAISQLATSLSEARPKVSGRASRLHSRPRHATHPPWAPLESPHIDPRPCAVQNVLIEHWLTFPLGMRPSHLVKQLIGLVATIDSMGAEHFAKGRIDADLRDRFTQLADALRAYDDKAKRKKSADGEQPSAKRPRPG